MTKKDMVTIECPYCNKVMGKQGIYGHIRGNHKDMEDDYRTRFPPKMTSVKPKNKIVPEEPKDIIEETMPEEPQPQPVIETSAPKEESKPEPEPVIVKESGDPKAKKGQSFLDWLFGDDEEKPKSESKTGTKKEDDDWW